MKLSIKNAAILFASLASVTAVAICDSASDPVQCGTEMRYEAQKDYVKLQNLSNNGNHCAQLSLGRAYLFGDESIRRNKPKALELTTQAAEGGLAEAQYELGLLYMGFGPNDAEYPKVVFWLDKAANQGHVSAQTLLGKLLLEGKAVPRDIHRGMMLLLEADSNGGNEAKDILLKMALQVSTAPPANNDSERSH